MTTDERRKNLGYRDAILTRVADDSLECVDSADSHIKALIAELVDGVGEALCDLPATTGPGYRRSQLTGQELFAFHAFSRQSTYL